jgi:uncharacterized protein YndB with AHSA1/START domain
MSRTAGEPLTDQPAVIHDTFRIEKTYPQYPARVFHAFADKGTVRRWRVEGDGFKLHEFTFDFCAGGSEASRFSYMDGPEIRLDSHFHDVAPNSRIDSARGREEGCRGLLEKPAAELRR